MGYSLLAALLCAAAPAAAQDLAAGAGQRIKAEQPAKEQQPAGSQHAEPVVVPSSPSACQLRLKQIASFLPLAMLAGPGECGAADAVLLQSVTLTDQAKVTIVPPATLRCTMAEEIARWLREDVAPAALALGAPLREMEEVDSYECRSRNRVAGAMLSEHGRANALDVRALVLSNGKVIGLTDVNIGKDWRERVRSSACVRFSTVLGPGADGYHEDHIHLDLAARRSGYKMCEWDLREPTAKALQMDSAAGKLSAARIAPPVPLPRPRPPAESGRSL